MIKKHTVEERRTEILEVTCEVVIERGFAGTRISDVAKRLEVSSSLIHYHFDSKEQLLAEAFAHYARKDLAEMMGELESAPNAIARLDRVIQNSVPEGSDDVEWMLWIDGWGEALRNPMMKKISQELDEQSVEVLADVIRGGVDSGEFVCPDPHAAAMRLTALIDGLAIQFAAHHGMMDRGQLIDHVRHAAAAEVAITPSTFGLAEAVGEVERYDAPGAATDAALRQLVARASDAVVRGDADDWAATWAKDATWEPSPGKAVSGRDEIVSAWAKARKPFAWVVQTPGAAVFEVDETAGVARGRVTLHDRFKRTTGKHGEVLAVSHDTFERLGGRWSFTERRLEVIESV